MARWNLEIAQARYLYLFLYLYPLQTSEASFKRTGGHLHRARTVARFRLFH